MAESREEASKKGGQGWWDRKESKPHPMEREEEAWSEPRVKRPTPFNPGVKK